MNNSFSYITYLNLTNQNFYISIDENISVKNILPYEFISYKKIFYGYHTLTGTFFTEGEEEVEPIFTKKLNIRPSASFVVVVSPLHNDATKFKCTVSEEKPNNFDQPNCQLRVGNFCDNIENLSLIYNKDEPTDFNLPAYTTIGSYYFLEPKKYKLKLSLKKGKDIILSLPKLKPFRAYSIFLVYNSIFDKYELNFNVDMPSYKTFPTLPPQ